MGLLLIFVGILILLPSLLRSLVSTAPCRGSLGTSSRQVHEGSPMTEDFIPPSDEPMGSAERKIFRWRYESFERMGFPAYHCIWLASHTEVELSSARKLIDRGCSPELAMEILT